MKYTSNVNTGLIKIEFKDEDDDVFASCKINPTDVRLIRRSEEISEFFKNKEMQTDIDLEKLEDILKEKMCYLLGYDAEEELFGLLTATSINQDGEMWGMIVLYKIMEYIEPEIEKRKQKMVSAIDKYTGKYQK